MRLQVADAVSKAKSAEYGAQIIVPLLAPLLTTHSLPPQLFNEYMTAVRDVLTRVEKWRMHGGNNSKAASTSGRERDGHAPAANSAVSWDDLASSTGGPTTSGNGAVPALGLGGAEGGADSWASFAASPGASAAASGASSPNSLRSAGGGAGGNAAAGTGAGVPRPHSSNGLAQAPGPPGGAMGRPATRTGSALGGAAPATASSPLNATKTAGAGGTAGAASDAFAGLGVGGGAAAPRTSQQPLRAPPPALPPPPSAASSDPFAELCMAQPKPTLARQAAKGGATHVGAPSGVPAAPAGGIGVPHAAADAGGDWDDWDPFH